MVMILYCCMGLKYHLLCFAYLVSVFIKQIYLIMVMGVFLMSPYVVHGQSGWDWRDPNDLGAIDLGDNKVIGYNLLGIGAALLFDQDGKKNSSLLHELSLGRLKEYRRDPLSDLWTMDYRAGRSLRPYLTWGVGARAYAVGGVGVRTSGLGGYLWFRWHLINKDKFRVSYDNGVGPNYFLKAFPQGGTRFNFTTHYGLSFSIRNHDRWWSITFSNFHISNAEIKGRDRNPALDAIGVVFSFQL